MFEQQIKARKGNNNRRIDEGIILITYFFLKPFYLFSSGLPQISDMFLFAATIALLLRERGKLRIPGRYTLWIMIFIGTLVFQTFVQAVWWTKAHDNRMMMYVAYYIFNFVASVLCIYIVGSKIGVAGAECIFFQNEENKQFFETHRMIRKGTRTKLLPGSGVSLKMHKAMPYPAEDGQINFLFIARIMKEKGIDLYLGAAKRIYEKHKNVMFHICGLCDDEKYNGLLKEAEKDGYILYHGEQKNMIPFFEMAHCIVHPSYYPEGMSNVLLEAAAHCRPIITTDRSGCRETVEDGKTGFVIPIKDEDALAEALERFLAMSWEQKRNMGLAGRAKIEREFDRQIVVQLYEEEVERVFA